jgi:hypothetical protein
MRSVFSDTGGISLENLILTDLGQNSGHPFGASDALFSVSLWLFLLTDFKPQRHRVTESNFRHPFGAM